MIIRLAALGLALLCLAGKARACGPFFPNNLLDRGDQAVLLAPLADFERELDLMHLPPSRFTAVPPTEGYDGQTFDAEMADLAAALRKAKVPDEERARVLDAHQANRNKLRKFQEEWEAWQSRAGATDENGNPLHPQNPCPAAPKCGQPLGLPAEFADYFAGAVAWHSEPTNRAPAREAWERLLARPATERRYRSTWAAFMLGKSWEEEEDDKAMEYFRMTRELAKRGFADSIGLASAALGLEARVELRRQHFKRAIELYLEQRATGDGSALESLRITAQLALSKGGDELNGLAATPSTRAVILAYLISSRGSTDYPVDEASAVTPMIAWLKAVEAAQVKDMDSAERLALAAYRGGEFDIAKRWVARARSSPVAQWIQAKLLLREGKVAPAAALLAKVSRSFPLASPGTNTPTGLADNLFLDRSETYYGRIPAGRQALGELGVLQLARREYANALDSLLRAGFWMDAAYVAERVLTVGELKSYVDSHWQQLSLAEEAEENHTPRLTAVEGPVLSESQPVEVEEERATPDNEIAPATLRHNIRYLLARRLTRLSHGDQARDYFPIEWHGQLDALVTALNAGWHESLPREQRAQSLFAAAQIARAVGMELLGTEVGPDWHIHGGNFAEGVSAGIRTGEDFQIVRASADELRRATAHDADPETRFHYRYHAALLAWEAAKLMPNNTDETARVLWTAGTWLKDRDPATADIFYKSLVRRCRKTALGDAADRLRWFPRLDENGNLIARKPAPVAPSEDEPLEAIPGLSPSDPPPAEDPQAQTQTVPGVGEGGYEYTVAAGDSLLSIVTQLEEYGISVTEQQISEANPGMGAGRLRVGQKILIPMPIQKPE